MPSFLIIAKTGLSLRYDFYKAYDAINIQAFQLVLIGCYAHILGDKIYSWLPKRRYFKIKLF